MFFCYKSVLVGFLCVWVCVKNRNRALNCVLGTVSCLWRIFIDKRISNIQEQVCSGQVLLTAPVDLVTDKLRARSQVRLLFPTHQAAEFGYQYLIHEPWSFPASGQAQTAYFGLSKTFKDLPFFCSLDFSHATKVLFGETAVHGFFRFFLLWYQPAD